MRTIIHRTLLTEETLLAEGLLKLSWVFGDRYQVNGWRIDDDRVTKVYVDAVYDTFDGKPKNARPEEKIVAYEGVIGAIRKKIVTVEDLQKWIAETVPAYCSSIF